MSRRADKARQDARDLRDRLNAEGRHRDAEIIQRLVRGFESASTTCRTLHQDNDSLRRMNAWYPHGQSGQPPE